MMKIRIIICILVSVVTSHAVEVGARQTKKMGITIAQIGAESPLMKELAHTVKNDLAFTGQFELQIVQIDRIKKIHQVQSYAQYGPLMVALQEKSGKYVAEWRLYDTRTGKMIVGRHLAKSGKVARQWGHALANSLITELTKNDGPFCSKIVYCKEYPKQEKTDICIADYDGQHEHRIVSLNSFAIGPRWNADIKSPLIMYSEYTPLNVRLMMTDLKGNKSVATSFEGLNMLPAFSLDGAEAIVCLSAGGSSQLYRYAHDERAKKSRYTRLTKNDGNNLSPSIMENGNILFCSDFQTRSPQIYIMDRYGDNICCITTGGFCTSPSYSQKSGKITYSKIVEGYSQLMVYDISNKKTIQLTSDPVHKTEASWSPCGNYLLFSADNTKTKRLAVESLLTKERIYITDGSFRYSYPSWSPSYPEFPDLG